ncbi:GNAT family N-acetyltransferase [Candidatus Promineifilum breve]|nr:GNAT family N-acetyltransferase [Candidatus Promineifilum breve]
MGPAELSRLGEIDRTERITSIYVQHGVDLEEQPHNFDVPPWLPTGDGFHSIPHQIGFCEEHIARGALLFGAFDGERLVGMGLMTPQVRPGIAQLAHLHVSDRYRGRGVGRRLVEKMAEAAREMGDLEMVVSSSPSANTVRFYMGCGFAPMAEPLAELFEKEPEDVHLSKRLD